MRALLVIDMQKDFCYESGALFLQDAKRIIPLVKNLIARARKRKIPVIYTQDWHRMDDAEFSLWPPHCIENTEGAEIVDELSPAKDDFVVRKRRYSAFFGTDLDLHLREKEIKNLVLSGVCTNICVLHTASDAMLLGYRITVVEDCVASLSPYDQDYALNHIKEVLKGEVKSSATL
jgi:nicotinamidase-related amidase